MIRIKYKLKSIFYIFNVPLMYISQKNYIKPYKYVDNIHNKYLLKYINRFFNCSTTNMYIYYAHNTHCTCN
jgi:hypothetical protein